MDKSKKQLIIIIAATFIIGAGIATLVFLLGGNSKTKTAETVAESEFIAADVESTAPEEEVPETVAEAEEPSTEESGSAESPAGNAAETAVNDSAQQPASDTQTAEAAATEAAAAEAASPSAEAAATEAPAPAAASGTPVSLHGELKVNGTHLVDCNGRNFQIKGVSTHGLAWFPEYVNKASFQTLRDEWGANCVRLAMYTAEYGGYCEGGSAQMKTMVNNGVSYATELGMYVIIDWHILQDQDPNKHTAEAIAFFDEMSAKYAGYDNVIYEICNEPNGGVNWPTIKNYAEQVIPVIKKNNPDAIIIVGTPTWSQEVDKAAADPITGYTNIMYTLHFYAATHKDSLRKTMQNAINSGLPIFVTEFGTCDASGSGGNDFNSANAWVELMDKNSVSYCIWSLCNKNETAALISSGCSKTSGWLESDLSDAGKWYVGVLNNGVPLGSLDINDSSQSSQPSDNSNNSSSSEPAASSSSGNTGVTLTQSNHWNDGKADFYQYVVNVKNTSSSKISGWSVTVSFGGNVSIDQSWSGNITASGNTVSIKPQDFNSSLAAGESVEVGFIVKTNESLGTPAVTVGN